MRAPEESKKEVNSKLKQRTIIQKYTLPAGFIPSRSALEFPCYRLISKSEQYASSSRLEQSLFLENPYVFSTPLFLTR